MNEVRLIQRFPVGSGGISRRTVSEADVVLFSGLTGDFYGVHVDQVYASGTRFGRCIAHGAMAVGLISSAVTDLALRCDEPGALPVRFDVKFTGPIFPGDTIESRVTVSGHEEDRVLLEAVAENQEGTSVVVGKVELRCY